MTVQMYQNVAHLNAYKTLDSGVFFKLDWIYVVTNVFYIHRAQILREWGIQTEIGVTERKKSDAENTLGIPIMVYAAQEIQDLYSIGLFS